MAETAETEGMAVRTVVVMVEVVEMGAITKLAYSSRAINASVDTTPTMGRTTEGIGMEIDMIRMTGTVGGIGRRKTITMGVTTAGTVMGVAAVIRATVVVGELGPTAVIVGRSITI